MVRPTHHAHCIAFLAQFHTYVHVHSQRKQAGVQVLKHPRSGKPAPRFLVLHDGIIGCTEKADNYKALAKKGFHLSEIRAVSGGGTTPIFSRTLAAAEKSGNAINPECCFSLMLESRSLDIQCESPEQCAELCAGLARLMSAKRTRPNTGPKSPRRS